MENRTGCGPNDADCLELGKISQRKPFINIAR